VFFIFGGSLVFCFRFLEIVFKFPLSNPLALKEGFAVFFFKLNVHGHTYITLRSHKYPFAFYPTWVLPCQLQQILLREFIGYIRDICCLQKIQFDQFKD
jgi:hypothetical protein